MVIPLNHSLHAQRYMLDQSSAAENEIRSKGTIFLSSLDVLLVLAGLFISINTRSFSLGPCVPSLQAVSGSLIPGLSKLSTAALRTCVQKCLLPNQCTAGPSRGNGRLPDPPLHS